jgi:hypothetical protein
MIKCQPPDRSRHGDGHSLALGFVMALWKIGGEEKCVGSKCGYIRYSAPFFTVKLTYLYEPKSLADAWDDDEIIRLTESSIYLSESNSLFQISDDTVVKLGHTFY